MNGELLRIIDTIHRDRGIDKEILFEGIESALLTAARKKYGESETLTVRLDRSTGEVVAEDQGERLSMDFGRIAAQTAKQVILQKIREAEQDAVYAGFENRRGQVITGSVQRVEGGALIVNLGNKAEGIMPRHEQVRGETYHVGDRIRCYVHDVRKVGTRVKIILSRTHPDFVAKLFELEVPEVAEKLVVLRRLEREAGYKTKIAVESVDDKVDPIGACVGVRGSRIKNIIEEVGGEKIDIIRYSDDPTELIVNALKPATVNSITLDPDQSKAWVTVDEDQLSLAIGKRGQNVRLAARLSSWDIDIMTDEEAERRAVIPTADVEEVAYLDKDGETVATTPTSPDRTAPDRTPPADIGVHADFGEVSAPEPPPDVGSSSPAAGYGEVSAPLPPPDLGSSAPIASPAEVPSPEAPEASAPEDETPAEGGSEGGSEDRAEEDKEKAE